MFSQLYLLKFLSLISKKKKKGFILNIELNLADFEFVILVDGVDICIWLREREREREHWGWGWGFRSENRQS